MQIIQQYVWPNSEYFYGPYHQLIDKNSSQLEHFHKEVKMTSEFIIKKINMLDVNESLCNERVQIL